MGICKQLSRGVDSELDNTSDNNTGGNISDNTSRFDNIGVLWKQYPPVVTRIRDPLWRDHLW